MLTTFSELCNLAKRHTYSLLLHVFRLQRRLHPHLHISIPYRARPRTTRALQRCAARLPSCLVATCQVHYTTSGYILSCCCSVP